MLDSFPTRPTPGGDLVAAPPPLLLPRPPSLLRPPIEPRSRAGAASSPGLRLIESERQAVGSSLKGAGPAAVLAPPPPAPRLQNDLPWPPLGGGGGTVGKAAEPPLLVEPLAPRPPASDVDLDPELRRLSYPCEKTYSKFTL